MPNWCYNNMSISTKTPKQFVKLIQGISNDSERPFDFNRVVPMPEELANTTSPNQDPELSKQMIDKYGHADWYSWSCANWGTKWNACDVELDLESPTSVNIKFNTAWSPPTPIFYKIAELYPFATIEVRYEEDGMGYWGTLSYEGGSLISEESGDMDCDYRNEVWGECGVDSCEECGECDCQLCECPNRSKQTLCESCNENVHEGNPREEENESE